MLKCNDGSYCNIVEDGSSCCNGKGGRSKCPKNKPRMCVGKECANSTDHCCGTDRDCKKHNGGVLGPCKGAS